ncbi:MAG: relaxase/mobilization nuclease domain-containing protein [Salinivirgaceae bacterium]|nr:relaxase/mobilization nuclease domain-containing protein [Salinivirgaceae bacterium]
MISKILSGKSLTEAVEYNEQKVREGVAELIDINNIPSTNYVKETLAKVSGFNRRCEKPVFHLSLSFPSDERELSNNELSQIAKEFMTKFGFGEHPYAVYRHKDTSHPHIHIVSTRISWKGEYKNFHQEHRLAGKIAGEIEEKYGLIKVDRSKKKKEGKAKRITTGSPDKNNVRQHITDAITNTLAERKCFDIKAFEERLKSFGVGMDVRDERVSYYLINEEGEQTTRAISASSIFIPTTQSAAFSPTYKKLNAAFNKQRKSELKNKFRWLQKYEVVSKKAFESFLEKNHLKIEYVENAGGVYGIKFLDTKYNTEYKGSDLGCSWAQLKNLLASKVSVKKCGEREFVAKCYNLLLMTKKQLGESELLADDRVASLLYEAVTNATNKHFAESVKTMIDILVSDKQQNNADIRGKERLRTEPLSTVPNLRGHQLLDSLVDSLAASSKHSGMFDFKSTQKEPKGVIYDDDSDEDLETKIKKHLGKLIK